MQNAAIEIKEMLQQVIGCDITNVVHTARLTRLGELHISKAKSFNAKLKVEVQKAKRRANDCKIKGVKNISNAIGGPRAKPLTCVFRDRDTEDGGTKGQMTAEPREVDAVVKRAWQVIYKGMSGCFIAAVEQFLNSLVHL